MRYECPYCGSMKKPKIIKYFPPVTVQCLECKKEGIEKEFIKKGRDIFTYLQHIH